MTASDFLVDAAVMSFLLFVAQFLRAHIRLLQKSLLPCSVIAGLIGLALGPQFVNILPFSDSISSYSGVLIIVLFSSLFIGSETKGSFKKTMSEAGDTFLLNSAVYFGQYAFALLLGGAFMAALFPNVNVGFSMLMPGGFIGGHGTAATFGSAFEELCGWDEALTLGQTFATIGILSGVIFGAMCINIATKKRATRFITKASELPEGMRTGLVPPDEQESIGRATVNSMSIDPLAWHLALILIASGTGYLVTKWINSLVPGLSIPTFSVGMLCGVVLQFILKALKLTQYVDREVISKIGSSVTDYLVGFAVASIKVSVVIKYAVPLIVLTIIGLIFVFGYLLLVSRKLFHNFWFERGIFIFGWSTGVTAIGVTLMRVVDPGFRSKTLEDYGTAYVFMSFIEIGLIAVLPSLVVSGYQFAAGAVCLVVFVILLAICAKLYGVFKGKCNELRPGEAEVLAEK